MFEKMSIGTHVWYLFYTLEWSITRIAEELNASEREVLDVLRDEERRRVKRRRWTRLTDY